MKNFPESHTAINIKNYIEDTLKIIGIKNIQNTKIVTDSGANMKAACKDMSWYPCMCHKLNTAISNGWDSLKKSNDEIRIFDASVNRLVTHIQHKPSI